jgi:hypothetical protein
LARFCRGAHSSNKPKLFCKLLEIIICHKFFQLVSLID